MNIIITSMNIIKMPVELFIRAFTLPFLCCEMEFELGNGPKRCASHTYCENCSISNFNFPPSNPHFPVYSHICCRNLFIQYTVGRPYSVDCNYSNYPVLFSWRYYNNNNNNNIFLFKLGEPLARGYY